MPSGPGRSSATCANGIRSRSTTSRVTGLYRRRNGSAIEAAFATIRRRRADIRLGCAFSFRRRDPTLGPLADTTKGCLQFLAGRGQFVCHAHRRTGVDVTRDDFFALEFAQPFGEQSIRKIGNRAEQLVESARTAQERAENRTGPALADQFDGVVEAWAEIARPAARLFAHYSWAIIPRGTAAR